MPRGHDIVTIGASAGGLAPLLDLAAELPADLPASVFMVLHLRPTFSTALPELLSSKGKLRASFAVHGEPIEPGRIYVAPPDVHLTLRPGHVQVQRGPKESGHRPAVDALFRSASIAYGSRVIGVVLSGYQDDGTAGLMSIKARGGIAVVQDPGDAAVVEMPRSAMTHVAADHVVSLDQLPTLLTKLVAEPALAAKVEVPTALAQLEGAKPGAASDIVCPVCQGKLTVSEHNGFELYRCHVGHAFSLESVAAEQAEEIERALWAAVRALEEGAALSKRMGERASGELRDRFLEKKDAQSQQADLIRQILLAGDQLTPLDAATIGARTRTKRSA
jgi:two-component system chemotaxis response regulator CheB